MRKIRLKHYEKARKNSLLTVDKFPRILLGNGLKFTFTGSKDLNQFLAETSRFLNVKMCELNEIYIKLFQVYRQNFQHIEHKEMAVYQRLFTGVDRSFLRILSRTNEYYLYGEFFTLCDQLNAVPEMLIRIQERRRNFSEIYVLRSIEENINRIQNQLKTWGRESRYFDPLPWCIRSPNMSNAQ